MLLFKTVFYLNFKQTSVFALWLIISHMTVLTQNEKWYMFTISIVYCPTIYIAQALTVVLNKTIHLHKLGMLKVQYSTRIERKVKEVIEGQRLENPVGICKLLFNW